MPVVAASPAVAGAKVFNAPGEAHGGPTVTLNPPATLAQLNYAESAMRVKLPSEIRDAHLRHNGVSRLKYLAMLGGAERGPSLFLPMYDWRLMDAIDAGDLRLGPEESRWNRAGDRVFRRPG